MECEIIERGEAVLFLALYSDRWIVWAEARKAGRAATMRKPGWPVVWMRGVMLSCAVSGIFKLSWSLGPWLVWGCGDVSRGLLASLVPTTKLSR